MDSRLKVKAILRAHLLKGPLSFKALETPGVPERRLRKAADHEEVKDLRVWELREVLAEALRANPDAALDLLAELLALREAGVIVALAPKAAPGVTDAHTESCEVVEAAADLERQVRERKRDGSFDAADQAAIANAAARVQREAAEVGVVTRACGTAEGLLPMVAR